MPKPKASWNGKMAESQENINDFHKLWATFSSVGIVYVILTSTWPYSAAAEVAYFLYILV